MATARKHYFNVPDSIGDEGWPNDVVATLIRLQAKMNTRWARNGLTAEQAGVIRLSPGEVMAVTGKSHRGFAEKLLKSLENVVSMSVECFADVSEVSWPKWPIFQGLHSRSQGDERPKLSLGSPSPQTQTLPQPQTQKKKDKEPSPTAPAVCVSSPMNGSPIPKPRKPLKTLMPEEFSDEDWERLVRLTNLEEAKLQYAWNTVYNWSHAGPHVKADWILTTLNAIRAGWALKGYSR